MMVVLLAILIALVATIFFKAGEFRERDRHKRPWEYDWVEQTPYQKLEEWWNATQSKDARIAELERLVTQKSSLISSLENQKQVLLRDTMDREPQMSLAKDSYLASVKKRPPYARVSSHEYYDSQWEELY